MNLKAQNLIKIRALGSGEAIPNALFICTSSQLEIESDELGMVRFSGLCPIFDVYRIGYADTTLIWNEDLEEFYLRPTNQLDEITIYTNRPDISRESQYEISYLMRLPSIGGERDVLKSLALTAGVNQTVEGTSNLSVRGGSPDQNLLLMDGAKIYNTNHFFGFLSSINPDVVKDINFYKSFFPAEHESRMSSVASIILKDGNKNQKSKKLSIGTMTSSFLIEGPIADKTNYILGIRTAYPSLILLPKIASSDYVNYYLYDLDAKISRDETALGKISASFHSNSDNLISRSSSDVKLTKSNIFWGNNALAINQIEKIGQSNLLKTTITANSYFVNLHSKLEEEDGPLRLRNKSSVKEAGIKSFFDAVIHNNITNKIGLFYQIYNFKPFSSKINSAENQIDIINPGRINQSFGLFNDLKFENDWLALIVGWRIEKWKLTNNFKPLFVQPRLAMSLKIDDGYQIRAEYSHLNQTLHSLASGTGSYIMDLWLPSDEVIKPQSGQQFNLGLFSNKHQFKWGLETYYKELFNQIMLNPGFELLSSKRIDEWQSETIKNGQGRSFGIEMYFGFKTGKMDFKGNYTMAWAYRKFQQVNNGEWFFSDYDKRHVLNLTGLIVLPKNWDCQYAFVFGTGRPFTAPDASGLPLFVQDPKPLFTAYNNARFPINHRLDVSFSKSWINKKNRSNSLNLSIYNLYANPNVFGIYFINGNNTSGSYQLRQKIVSFFRFIPGISYSINL